MLPVRSVLAVAGVVLAVAGPASAAFIAGSESAPITVPACKHSLTRVTAEHVEEQLANADGRGVIDSGVCVGGALVLTGDLKGPFVLKNSIVTGGIDATSESFPSVVDLTGTRVFGKAEFYATTFASDATFYQTAFLGQADFTSTTFGGTANFYQAWFSNPATFTDASFGAATKFQNIHFPSGADFTDVSFGGNADFTSGHFGSRHHAGGSVDFDRSNFLQGATFLTTGFALLGRVSFIAVQFGSGADFSGARFPGQVFFNSSRSQGDLGFQGASLPGSADFSNAFIGGDADFEDATIGGGEYPVFTDAIVHSLNMTNLTLLTPLAWKATTPTRIDELRMNSGSIAGLQFDNHELDPRQKQEAFFQMFETAASQTNDFNAANAAKIRRLTLERGAYICGPHMIWGLCSSAAPFLDRSLYWGIGGYFVRPLHPAIAIVVLFLLGILIRFVSHRDWRHPPREVAAKLGEDAQAAFGAFRKIKPSAERSWFELEALAYTILLVVLAVNLESVSPSIRSLVEGIL
jgi:uncharacterized protein YjbI with pentapeptide repeats